MSYLKSLSEYGLSKIALLAKSKVSVGNDYFAGK